MDVTHDGVGGVLKAHVYEYDLLVLDVMLPGRTGLEIVQDLRKERKQVPVLLQRPAPGSTLRIAPGRVNTA